MLAWVARLGISGVEPAACALGLSRAVIYSHLSRLIRQGLLERLTVGDGAGGAILLTRRGARVAREHGTEGVVSPWSASSRAGRHGRAVSWVAAAAELRGWRWLGPAQLRGDGWTAGTERGHAPNLGLAHADTRTAIEVELHLKSKDRLAAILAAYRHTLDRGSFTAVSYVVDRADVRELVRRLGNAALLGHDLHVGPLDAIIRDVRARAARP